MADVEIFQEILGSDQLGTFNSWNQYIINQLGDNPSVLWDRIQWDPWTALAIFEDMEDKDSTLFSCLEKRRDSVLACPRFVKPASEKRQDKKIAEFVEETLEQFWGKSESILTDSHKTPFESFLNEALEAVGDGLTIGEIVFGNGKDRIYVEEVKFKPQHLFSFGDTALAPYSGGAMMYPQTGPLCLRAGVMVDKFAGERLPEWKFFVFSYQIRKGNRWGSPLKRKCFWQTWIKRHGVRNWLRYIEKSAASVVARYPGGASQAEQDKALQAASAIVEENAIAVPERFTIEVHEMVRNIGASHKELVDDYCNAEIARSILGNTLTSRGSDGGGSRALGEVHERVEQRKKEKDAKALMSAVNHQIVAPLVFHNFGANAALPEWTLQYEAGEDLNTMAERYGKLKTQVGLPLPKKHTYEVFQIPEPIDETDVLGETPDMEKRDPKVDQSDEKTELAEKKKLIQISGSKSNSKTERFKRLRPSMIHFSEE